MPHTAAKERKGRAAQPGQIINPQPLKGGCNSMIPQERPERIYE
jgi:hypothetical protein